MIDLISHLDPTIIAIIIVVAILAMAKLSEDKEMETDINTKQKEKVVHDKYYYMDLWDKICFWFWLPIAIAFFTAPTIASFIFSGNYHDGMLIQAIWITVLLALFRTAKA